MNNTPENFDRLKRLLALKRYEQPPPRYFLHFSDKILAHIESEGLTTRVAWWRRLLPELDASPLLACAYGLVIMGLLVVGIGVSRSLDTEETAAPNLGTPWFAQTPTPIVVPASLANTPLTQSFAGQNNSSVNAVIDGSAPAFLFDVNQLKVRPVNYTFPAQ